MSKRLTVWVEPNCQVTFMSPEGEVMRDRRTLILQPVAIRPRRTQEVRLNSWRSLRQLGWIINVGRVGRLRILSTGLSERRFKGFHLWPPAVAGKLAQFVPPRN
jgi:hypothetical protein